jgi:hypothetical protein
VRNEEDEGKKPQQQSQTPRARARRPHDSRPDGGATKMRVGASNPHISIPRINLKSRAEASETTK